MELTAEEQRLREARAGVPWRTWGPYLSERQWGTVREDYSDNGDAWSYFTALIRGSSLDCSHGQPADHALLREPAGQDDWDTGQD